MFISVDVQKDVEQMDSALRRHASILAELGLSENEVRLDEDVLGAFSRMVSHLRENPQDANLKRILYALDEGHKVLEKVMRLERKFLISLCASDMIRSRIVAIDPAVGKHVWEAYRKWDGMRTTGGQILTLRQAYIGLVAIVARAEENATADRVRQTLLQSTHFRIRPAKKVKKRSASDAEYREAVRGHNPPPPKDGGGGTSRDARRRARKHQRA